MDGQAIYALCKQIADDPDTSFESTANWATALQQGYASYQALIANQLPSIYEKTYDFTVSGSSTFDLNGILFGATPSTGDRLYNLTKMHTVNVGSQPDFGYWLTPATSMEQLWAQGGNTASGGTNWLTTAWLLQGTKILFNAQINQTLRLLYIPSPTINWATAIASPGVFIDNTPDFAQQAIAFYAYKYYAIKDWQQNAVAQQRFDSILAQIRTWIAVGRNGDASRWVQPGRQRSNFLGSSDW